MASNPALRLKQVGSNAEIARCFGISREAVRLWMSNGIPPDLALDVEELTKGAISAQEILVFAREHRGSSLVGSRKKTRTDAARVASRG